MIQVLRFDKEGINDAEYKVISDTERFKYFLKQALYLLVLIYSTIFLAAAIPFEGTYFIGGLITGIFLLRIINDVIMFNKFKNGSIAVSNSGVEVKDAKNITRIKADDISYCEVNVLGNFVVREKYSNKAFPFMLLSKENRHRLTSSMVDMSPKRTELFRKAWDFFDAVLVAFILAMHIRQFVIQAYFIPTGSMEDTLQVGDHLLVEKITFGPIIPKMIGMKEHIHLDILGLREVRRGDVIIFRPPNEEKKDFIKRCIAVPGDRVNIKDGSVWINGVRQEEPYTKNTTSYHGFSDRKIEGVVPENMIVAMGDNRENSYDSRGFGYLPIKRIKGKALLIYWNSKQIKNLNFSRLGIIH